MVAKKNMFRPGSLATLVLVFGLTMSTPGCGRSELDTATPPTSGATAGTGGGGGASAGVLPELPPTPGFLLCGSELCTASSQQCCLGVSSSGGLAASCARAGAVCTGASLRCDEPADCKGSDVCCFGLLTSPSSSSSSPSASPRPMAGSSPIGAGLTIGSRCEARASCAGVGQLILCRRDGDCPPGTGVCCPGVGVPTCQPGCTGR